MCSYEYRRYKFWFWTRTQTLYNTRCQRVACSDLLLHNLKVTIPIQLRAYFKFRYDKSNDADLLPWSALRRFPIRTGTPWNQPSQGFYYHNYSNQSKILCHAPAKGRNQGKPLYSPSGALGKEKEANGCSLILPLIIASATVFPR